MIWILGQKGIIYRMRKHYRYPPALNIFNGLKQDQLSILHFPMASIYR